MVDILHLNSFVENYYKSTSKFLKDISEKQNKPTDNGDLIFKGYRRIA